MNQFRMLLLPFFLLCTPALKADEPDLAADRILHQRIGLAAQVDRGAAQDAAPVGPRRLKDWAYYREIGRGFCAASVALAVPTVIMAWYVWENYFKPGIKNIY